MQMARSFVPAAIILGLIALMMLAIGVADAQKEFVGFASFKQARCTADSYEKVSGIGSEARCFKKCKKDGGCHAVSYNKKSEVCKLFDNQCKDNFKKASRSWSTSVRDRDGWVKMGHSGLHCATHIKAKVLETYDQYFSYYTELWNWKDCRAACLGTSGCRAFTVIDAPNSAGDPRFVCYVMKNCKVLASHEDEEPGYLVFSAAKTKTRVKEQPDPPPSLALLQTFNLEVASKWSKVERLAYSPDGASLAVSLRESYGSKPSRLWAVGKDGTLDKESPQILDFYASVPGLVGDLMGREMAWSPDGKFLAAAGYREINAEATDPSERYELILMLWVVGTDGTIDTTSPKVTALPVQGARSGARAGGDPSMSLAWSPVGSTLVMTTNPWWFENPMYVWEVNQDGTVDLRSDNPYGIAHPGKFSEVNAVDWSPDGSLFAAADQTGLLPAERACKVIFWRRGFLGGNVDITREEVFRPSTRYIDYMDWSPNGNLLAIVSNEGGLFRVHAVNHDGTAVSVDANFYQIILAAKTAAKNNGQVTALAWSPDSTFLAVGFDNWDRNDNTVYVIPVGKDGTTVDWSNRKVLTGFYQKVKGMAWSPDGKFLAVGSGQTYGSGLSIYGFE